MPLQTVHKLYHAIHMQHHAVHMQLSSIHVHVNRSPHLYQGNLMTGQQERVLEACRRVQSFIDANNAGFRRRRASAVTLHCSH